MPGAKHRIVSLAMVGLTGACGSTARLDPPIAARRPEAPQALEDRSELDKAISLEMAEEHANAAAAFAHVAERVGPSGWLWLRAAHAARRAGRLEEALDFGRRAIDDLEHQTGRRLGAAVRGGDRGLGRRVAWVDETTIATLEPELLLLRSALDGEVLAGIDVDASGGAARGGGAFVVCGEHCRFLSSVTLRLESAVVDDAHRTVPGSFDGTFAAAHEDRSWGRRKDEPVPPTGTVFQISGFAFHDLAGRFPSLLPTSAQHAVSADGDLLGLVDGSEVTLWRSSVDHDTGARVLAAAGKFDAAEKITTIDLGAAGRVMAIATEDGGVELARPRSGAATSVEPTMAWTRSWRKSTDCPAWEAVRLTTDSVFALCRYGAVTRFDLETGAFSEPLAIQRVDDLAVGPGHRVAAVGLSGELGVLLDGAPTTHVGFSALGETDLEVRRSHGDDAIAWSVGAGFETLTLATGATSRFSLSESRSIHAIASDGRVVSSSGAIEAADGSRKQLEGARGRIAWSRNEREIATIEVSNGGSDIQLFDAKSGRRIRTLRVETAFSGLRFIDGDRALLCERSADGAVDAQLARIDLSSGEATVLLQTRRLIDAQTSPRGDLVAVASRGDVSLEDFEPVELALIDAHTGAVLRRGPTSGVASLAISDSGLVAYATSRGIGFWRPGRRPDVPDGRVVGALGKIALTPDGGLALLLASGVLSFHDVETGEMRLQRTLYRSDVRSEVVVDPRSGKLEELSPSDDSLLACAVGRYRLPLWLCRDGLSEPGLYEKALR